MALVEANALLGIKVRSPELKDFCGNSKQAQLWLSAVKYYLQAVGLEEDKPSH